MRLVIGTASGEAWADLDRPRDAAALLVLTHGAGGLPDTRDLLAVRDAALAAGIAVALVTQAYRVAERRSPPGVVVQDESWATVVRALRRRRGLGRVPLVLGGRSNGARVACRTANELGAAAVVALAFPLHPPGRPDASRLPELELPTSSVLVVQGDRDPFGMPPAGSGREVLVVDGAGHTLSSDVGAVAEAVTGFITSVLARESG